MEVNKTDKAAFHKELFDFYESHGRHDLPWRLPEADGSFDPYKILISEMMLQQTQVQRVIPKYQQFLSWFPTEAILAASPLSEVLKIWNGLGYNRRAKYLWQAVQHLSSQKLPWSYEALTACKGIGPNTAAAVLVYSYDEPLVFIETNIRTVYIHRFFKDEQGVADSDIRSFLDQTLDTENPRNFYWALMDYGSYLKKRVGNLSKLSKHYTKQSPFQGSIRQIRGAVIKHLGSGKLSQNELTTQISDDRLLLVLQALEKEGLIKKRGEFYHLA